MAEEKREVIGRIRLEGVRLSFSDSLWTAKGFGDDEEGGKRFSANGLIEKNADGTSDLTCTYRGKRMPIMVGLKQAKIDAIAKKLNITAEKAAQVKIKPGDYACRDGDDENWDGYEGCWYVSANNSRKPKVIGRDRREVGEDEGIVYAGCYVNMIVTLWHQPAGTRVVRGGKKVTVPNGVYASLEGVQFVREGEAFGAAGIDVDEDFEDITDDSDEVDAGEFEDPEDPGNDGSGVL